MMSRKIERWHVAMLQPARGTTDWERDGGLLCLAFQSLGIESKFIALGAPRMHDEEPRIDATIEQMSDPEWWRQMAPDGVVLYSWAAPRFEPVARAIAEAGAALVVKVDCDGYKSPRQDWRRYLRNTYIMLHDGGKRWPALQAAVRTVLFGLVPAAHDLPMLRHLSHAAVIGIESPKAVALLRGLISSLGRDDLANRVRLIPHPVTMDMISQPDIPKEKLIVAVARWDAWAKDTPRMVDTLNRFLQREPEYRAELIGPGTAELEKHLQGLSPAVLTRIQVVGRIPHTALPAYYRRAQTILFTSRTEGCPVSAQEALCCGCSVVGPPHLTSMHWLCGERSGTVASDRSADALADALQAEANAWNCGERDPEALAAYWTERFHAAKVGQTIFAELKRP